MDGVALYEMAFMALANGVLEDGSSTVKIGIERSQRLAMHHHITSTLSLMLSCFVDGRHSWPEVILDSRP